MTTTTMNILASRSLTAAAALGLVLVAGRDGRAMDGADLVSTADVLQAGAVRVRLANGTFCSGTLLNDSWVLTAEHCISHGIASFASGASAQLNAPTTSAGAINGLLTVETDAQRRWIGAGWAAPDVFVEDIWREPMLVAIGRDGAPDTSFGGGGYVTTTFDGVASAELTAVVREPGADHRIVAVGRVDFDGQDEMLVARYGDDGVLDTSYLAAPGRRMQGYLPVPGVARAAAYIDGGLVVGGTRVDADGVSHWQAVRYHVGGALDAQLDTTFAPTELTQLGTLIDVVAVGAKLVWLGTRTGTTIIATTDGHGHGFQSQVVPAAVSSPAKLVPQEHGGAGVYVVGEAAGTAIAIRLDTATLTASANWPEAGATSTPVEDALLAGTTPRHMRIASAAIAPDGKLVVTGSIDTKMAGQVVAIVRFLTTAAPDPSLGQSGTLMVEYGDSYDVRAMGFDPYGDIAVAGNRAINRRGTAEVIRRAAWVALVRRDHSLVPAMQVVDAVGEPHDLVAVHLHPTPGIDVALLQLATPALTPGVTDTRFDNAMAGLLAPGTMVDCYGYGATSQNAAGVTERPLRTARFERVDTNGYEIRLTSPTASFEHGDSGGGCFAQVGSVVRFIGVISNSDDGRLDLAAGSRNFVVDPARYAPWVATTTGLPIDGP